MSSFFFKTLLGPQKDGVDEVSFSNVSQEVQLTAVGLLEDNQKAQEGGNNEENELLEDQQETEEDQSSLIHPSEDSAGSDDLDSNGVAREYEVALKYLGFGLFHILLLLVNGVALLSDAIEILSISFVLPVLNRPEEYGVGDTEEAVLSSIIFVGMLFGSYVWGSLADLIGRRTTIVTSLIISAAFGIFSAFSPWFWLFVLFRFFSGFGVGGSLPVMLPYISEFIRNKYRGPYLGMGSIFWMIGRLLCGAFAWAIIPISSINLPLQGFTFHSWRLFIAFSAAPSLIGALLFFIFPESPRFLLEVGKQEKAMKSLRWAYKLNMCFRRGTKEYPVKGVLLEATRATSSKDMLRDAASVRRKLGAFTGRFKEVILRTRDLFIRKHLRITLLMLIIMFCLSFGSNGVTLWFPTYVDQITTHREAEKFEAFCNESVAVSSSGLKAYCGCSSTVFADMDIKDAQLNDFRINDVIFSNVNFTNVSFTSVVFNGTVFTDGCQFKGSHFSSSYFNGTWIGSDTTFDMVTIESSLLCSMNGSDVKVDHPTTLTAAMFQQPGNGSNAACAGDDIQDIQCTPPTSQIYRDSFFISASAFPGNVISAIAVYFLQRNYWLAFSLFASTISVFLLYVSSSEAFVVVMLCIFTAVSTPAWNDTGLLMAELYPTYLRATAAGIHLLMARLGAIIGTNIFGLFIRVNPSIPIILVACILFAGSVAALGLPKTTRKTLLK